MDFSPALDAAVKLFVKYFNITFKVYGLTFSVGSVFVWVGIVTVVLWFIHRLDV